MIREVQPYNGTKTRRASLVAVQCAVLHDRHNLREPEDRRRRRWNYTRLADRFGLSSARVASDYVALGREILSRRDREEI